MRQTALIPPLLIIVSFIEPADVLAGGHTELGRFGGSSRLNAADFFMFRSYAPGHEDFVTVIANYQPFQVPGAGPAMFDPDALYRIFIDNDGDGVPDLTFTFRFTSTLRDQTVNVGGVQVPTTLPISGPISLPGEAPINILETYTVTIARGPLPEQHLRNLKTGRQQFIKPMDNVGPSAIPSYEIYAALHEYAVTIPGCPTPGHVFVGQRRDPLVANLGGITDNLNIAPLGPTSGGPNTLANSNISSIILEIPISCLTEGGGPVIGGWTASYTRRRTTFFDIPQFMPPSGAGVWVQVSRSAMPLVEEFIIGLRDQERFDAGRPASDARFTTYFTNPTFPAIFQSRFTTPAPCLPRNDLVDVYLTGISALNRPAHPRPALELRLNTTTPPTPQASQNPLGTLAGDPAGFPNGRRPGDDVVDITLRIMEGALLPAACAPAGNLPFTDNAATSAGDFLPTFPYLNLPIPGDQ